MGWCNRAIQGNVKTESKWKQKQKRLTGMSLSTPSRCARNGAYFPTFKPDLTFEPVIPGPWLHQFRALPFPFPSVLGDGVELEHQRGGAWGFALSGNQHPWWSPSMLAFIHPDSDWDSLFYSWCFIHSFLQLNSGPLSSHSQGFPDLVWSLGEHSISSSARWPVSHFEIPCICTWLTDTSLPGAGRGLCLPQAGRAWVPLPLVCSKGPHLTSHFSGVCRLMSLSSSHLCPFSAGVFV